MKALLLFSTFALSQTALSQAALDPLQGGLYSYYPDYIDHKCGAIYDSQVETGDEMMLRLTTVCPGSGRGSKPTVWLTCTRITFAPDRYYIVSRDRVLDAHWKYGQPAVACPV